MADDVKAPASPWLTIAQAAEYVKRGRRFLRSEVKSGRLRGAIIGQREQILTRREWLDQWVEAKVEPIAMNARRRA